MAKVTFECDAKQCRADANVHVEGEDQPFRKMVFPDGAPFFLLQEGRYVLRGRITGTPGTDFSLRAKEGGKMVPFKTTLPTAKQVGEDFAGRDTFVRLLTVEQKADEEGK